jgi:hypothetical protein
MFSSYGLRWVFAPLAQVYKWKNENRYRGTLSYVYVSLCIQGAQSERQPKAFACSIVYIERRHIGHRE